VVYHGRIIVAGETDSGIPFAGYAISGRSRGTQRRKLEAHGTRVRVSPLGELTSEQERLRDLIFYDAVRTKEDRLIVANGAQSDARTKGGKPILNLFDDFDPRDPRGTSERIMAQWGYEADPPIYTPRISLVRFPDRLAVFSMAARYQDRAAVGAVEVEADRGDRAWGLATYRADDDSAAPWSIRGSGDLPGCLVRIRIDGGSPREIAESLYGSLDPRFVVSAAGSTFSRGRWDVAVKNRFESEGDLPDG
jgi:IMP cyclohydrolase